MNDMGMLLVLVLISAILIPVSIDHANTMERLRKEKEELAKKIK